MFLSIILCTHNRAQLLDKVLKNLLEQEIPNDLKDDWEILVIDNNSSDMTKEIVNAYAELTNPVVRYLFEPRQGKSYALNMGIEAARGEILAFTDDDVLIDRRWISAIAEASRDYPQYRAFGGKVVPRWPKEIPEWIQPEGPYARPIVGGPIVAHDNGDEEREYSGSMWAPIGANMFFRRAVFSDYGRFRPDLGPKEDLHLWVNEDCEFCFRLMRNGEKILYYPKALITHPVPDGKLSKKYMLNYSADAGRKQAEDKDFPSMFSHLKSAARSGFPFAVHLVRYGLQTLRGNPAAAMHHRCHACLLAAKIRRHFSEIFMLLTSDRFSTSRFSALRENPSKRDRIHTTANG